MPRFVTCGPNEAIVVSGCCHSRPVMRAGGRVFIWPIFHKMQRISLNTMTLNVESPRVHSDGGVPVTVKGVAQVKIQGKDLQSLRAAAEMFLDKNEDEIRDIAKAILDGHQRSMIASMKIEDIYKSRHEFSKNVQQNAQADLVDMGLTLVSYTVQDISDDVGYLDALGQDKTEAVKCEARKECAQAKSFSECKNLETQQEQAIKKIEYEQAIALKQLDFDICVAKHMKEEFENKAKSERAGDLQAAEMNKQIMQESLKVILMEEAKKNELMLKKKELIRLELINEIEQQADFDCEREKELALAHKEKALLEARANAAKIRKIAEARSSIIMQEKEAEAEVLRERAEAFAQYGNAAKLEMVSKMLPRFTAEIAGPIAECNKITAVSQNGQVGHALVTNEISEIAEQVLSLVLNITNQSLAAGSNNKENLHPPGGGGGAGGSGGGGSTSAFHRKASTESIASTTGGGAASGTSSSVYGEKRLLSSFTRGSRS